MGYWALESQNSEAYTGLDKGVKERVQWPIRVCVTCVCAYVCLCACVFPIAFAWGRGWASGLNPVDRNFHTSLGLRVKPVLSQPSCWSWQSGLKHTEGVLLREFLTKQAQN